MQESDDTGDTPVQADRWTLIRDIAVFQMKLIVDGLRDLVLLPVSLAVGLYSLFRGGDNPGTEFYDLLRVGRRSEHWINLFGAAEHSSAPGALDDLFPNDDIDEIVSRLETFVVDEYNKGGVTAQAKKRLDQALNRLGEVASRKRRRGHE
jgi:hypothetical protein